MKLVGTNCNPFDAWLTYMGMKTLPLRMEKHCDNANRLATYLSTNQKIITVNHPSLSSHRYHEIAKKQMKNFGAMLSFELSGGLDAGIKFMNSLKMCSLAPTLGDVDTLILHPATMSHINVAKEIREQNGITDGLIRVSVGIEAIDDIIEDIERGLK
jgi:methionine-gamma-lyase